ncbi:MAG: CBS domain-containing protein [Desulfobacterales bacterium]|nr:CBS domain-containing protein [Desulfobacterales bacterium]
MRIVTTHKNTDFDGLASLVAATLLYPGAVAVLPKIINPNIKAFLSIHKDLFSIHSIAECNMDAVDSLVIVDTNSWGRLDGFQKLRQDDDLEIILWDHHAGEGDIQASWECREAVGANITLMLRNIKKEKMQLTPMQATLFLAGLYEDTGNLSFPSVTAEDAYAAAYLLETGADLHVLGSLLRPVYGQKQKNILFQMLQTAERIKVNGFTISINKLEIEGHVGRLSVVVNMYREIVNVDAAFGIFSDKDRHRSIVIGRSNIELLDMGGIMRELGGGGHPGAGSAMLKSIEPDAVARIIKDSIQGHQQTAIKISDLMSFPVLSVSSETSMREVALILREKGCTGVPVVDAGRLAGIISRRDFRKIRKDDQLTAPVKAFMSKKIITTEPANNPMEAIRLMVKHDIGRLPVLENGRIIGIITRSDAMRYFYDLLPD